MVRYFKINDPYRLLTLFLFVLALRVVIISLGHPFTGLHESYFADPNDPELGPLFLLVKDLINLGFENAVIPSAVLSGLLILLQAFSLNSILIRSKALTQNTYLPAACYVVILSASPEFMLLSPALCAVTFVLIGINNMLFHLQYRGSEENILTTGFVFGLAILFHPASVVFVVLLFAVYAIYSSTLARRYILIAFGLFLPLILFWLASDLLGVEGQFWNKIVKSIFSVDQIILVPIDQLLVLMGFPLIIALISSSQTFTGVGLTVHQIVTQRTMLFLGFFAIVSVFLNDRVSANSLIYLVPGFSFFGAQFLLTRERRWLSEATFLVLLLGSLAMLLLPILSPNFAPVDYSLLK